MAVTDNATGVLYRSLRCDECEYQKKGELTLEDYWDIGLCNVQPWVTQFTDGFGHLNMGNGRTLLEIGGGPSPYIDMVTRTGYKYVAVDPSREAINWVQAHHRQARGIVGRIEDVCPECDAAIAVRSLQYVDDLDLALKNIRDNLHGRFYVMVPNGLDDLENPSRTYFFTVSTLVAALENYGFCIYQVKVRSVVAGERYIYVVAC